MRFISRSLSYQQFSGLLFWKVVAAVANLSGAVLVFLNLLQFVAELKETGSSGATESEV